MRAHISSPSVYVQDIEDIPILFLGSVTNVGKVLFLSYNHGLDESDKVLHIFVLNLFFWSLNCQMMMMRKTKKSFSHLPCF